MGFTIFKARSGSGFSDDQAHEIGTELDKIALLSGGEYTADDVWTNAKDEDNPLHTYYEWNERKAAEAHWHERSLFLIRVVEIEVVHPDRPDDEPLSIWAYDRLPDVPGQRKPARFVSTSDLLRKPTNNRKQFIEEMIFRFKRELEKYDRLFKGIAEFEGLRKAIRTVKRELPDA